MHTPHILANAIRFLSVDAVEKAQSGHPGMPLGMADIATVLWQNHMKHNPSNPHWFNRDRFVLSNGHGAMLLYAVLHLTGYKLSIDDIKDFRQLHSKTPGHPESHETPGVEATTGPLGQGFANAVGMAIAEKTLAAEFNTEHCSLVDHHTYVFVGDGCLMEGISHEAASLAGTLQLGKLIVLYDDNGISIDGNTEHWFTDNTAERFRAYHWHVIDAIDGHDMRAIDAAISAAKAETTKPSFIVCKTKIGFASNLEGTEHAHGAPLGTDNIIALRERLNWPHPPFEIPKEIYAEWNHSTQGERVEQTWLSLCTHYQEQHPERYHAFLRRINGDLTDDWNSASQQFITQCIDQTKPMATRKASQHCLEFYCHHLPELLGGSADLTASNNTDWSGTTPISPTEPHGNYIHYGVREFGMSAMMNGIALHGGFIPYGGTFLVFCDYARNAIRLAAIMRQRVIFVYTHDSIGLGEDGPTHQPIEHITMLRATPHLDVWRPASLLETAVAWQQSIARHHGPSCLLLSRQPIATLSHVSEHTQSIERGAYILRDTQTKPTLLLIATGAEVAIAIAAAEHVDPDAAYIRVVSMPCMERFLAQDIDYQEAILPKNIRQRIAIEAGATTSWHRFVGLDGIIIGIDQFGLSAPAKDTYHTFRITIEHTIHTIKQLVSR